MTEMTPSQRYAAGVEHGNWNDDLAQHAALAELDRIHNAIIHNPQNRWLDRLATFWKKPELVQGLYFWGGVGRGKTFLVDLFYDGLPLSKFIAERQWSEDIQEPKSPISTATFGGGKYRTHFHRFMRGVHQRLRVHTGQSDPLAKIAKEWRGNLRVLVLDEFFVADIGDAMLLARLLEHLFAEGVILVTTSNTAPEKLYCNGLQRDSFLPAIDLLKHYCVELYAEGTEDYRMRALTASPVYRTPLDTQADAWLAQRWAELSGGATPHPGNIVIDGRKIPVRARGKSIAWLDFTVLCEGPRSTTDYIEIAREFNTVLIGGIPHFNPLNEDAAQRFVNLIDELYDRQVNLICTASGTPLQLYNGDRLATAFERTASRLNEMQSAEYLATAHRA
ncbi:AFG1 family ATPase [Xylella taiwanensis]|uniref:ATPase n=1 Tax=Xylella taiwanensis TaxID=1444770 RepID=Z9JJN6_9GAMM|nr:cell division protein ZapE [Xylella taiwanensis]AXI83513.1 ATPase [Xylella taiwanensis]EWS78016.1 ATPase [Xylella taiwanensis]MCD8456588.1 cell division protein ZapE [Xylella taiwanensis]MCD8458995.1 cell division protein ZapE [Xylella taiwanensis]MCD8461134.1 cell division protein ZapE [Xylella taiwanensis]